MKTPIRIGLGLAFMTGSLVSAQSTPQKPRPLVFGITVYCPLAGQGNLGVGWTQPVDGKYFRCVPTYDENLKLINAEWVQVEKGGATLSFGADAAPR
jgi:hypothetical protein